AVLRLDQADGLLHVLRRGQRVRIRLDLLHQVDGDDVRALLGQPDGVAAALAAGGTGDERDFAFKTAGHGGSSPLSACCIGLAWRRQTQPMALASVYCWTRSVP